MNGRRELVLGIDLGTTTVKACLVTGSKEPLVSLARQTQATQPSDVGSSGSEQAAHKICTAVQFCVSQLPKEQLARVTRVAVSGQMHGVVLWKQDGGWRRNPFGRFDVDAVSALYTWQDGRCSEQFLAELPKPDSHLRLSSGHGCATLLWLVRHRPELMQRFDRAGTIQDMLVAMLCQLDRPVTSTQLAASWGYFDTVSGTWNSDQLSAAGLPSGLLPDVAPPCRRAGSLNGAWYGVPSGTPVHVALGDMQCSVLSAAVAAETDAVLNMSTSAQLSFLLGAGFDPRSSSLGSTVEHFPYFDGRYLAVAASLNGGNVLAAFVRVLQQWTHELGDGVPETTIWSRLLACAAAVEQSPTDDQIRVDPTLFGERHRPGARASVHGIGPQGVGLGGAMHALCRGLLQNLHSMMPRDVLVKAGVTRIVGTGKALTRNPALQQAVRDTYGLELVLGRSSDAALGAAIAVLLYGEHGS